MNMVHQSWVQRFNQSGTRLILGSQSPRRKDLLTQSGLDFTIAIRPTDEAFDSALQTHEVAAFIAQKKAEAFDASELEGCILLTADTTVVIGNTILNKPEDRDHAIDMLKMLSGQTHSVFTAFCLKTSISLHTMIDETRVCFRELSIEEIEYYVDTCSPFDKAGSYGAQDWIGSTAITRIEGAYTTVLGLPMHLVVNQLRQLINI